MGTRDWGFSTKDFSAIVLLYHKYNPNANAMYLFLDEVQKVEKWEKFVRRLLERRGSRFS